MYINIPLNNDIYIVSLSFLKLSIMSILSLVYFIEYNGNS